MWKFTALEKQQVLLYIFLGRTVTLYDVPSCCDVVISYEKLRAVYEILEAICWAYLPDFGDMWKANEVR